MIADLAVESLPENLETDVCVIGAGPAGIAAALSLARRKIDVILLESGGRALELEPQKLSECDIVGAHHVGSREGRFRAFGGTSKKWGGQILPLFAIDFEPRPWLQGSGWPLGLEELRPYLDQALSFEGLARVLRNDRDVWQAAGLNLPDFGKDLESFLTRWCPQPDFGRMYWGQIKRCPNVRCILHATVTRLRLVEGEIRAVIAKSFSGSTIVIRARRFVFCGGAIETTRLLLQPLDDGASPPWVLASDIIGRFFQDHPGVTCADIIPRSGRVMHRLFDHIYFRGLKYQPRIMLACAKQSKSQTLNAGGIILAQSAHSEALTRTKAAGSAILRGEIRAKVMKDAFSDVLVSGPFLARKAWRMLVDGRAFNPSDKGFRLGVQVEQPPRPESRISLSASVDLFGMHRAVLDWRVGVEEINTIAVFAETVKTAFEDMGLADVHLDFDVASRSTNLLSRVVDQNHHMGTARMSHTPSTGVVDIDLKMFHAKNGYICSSAVFPTSSFSNPTHTLIALAIRLGDHLGAGWHA
jgi:choline dehydrogenase-like flavoprotein